MPLDPDGFLAARPCLPPAGGPVAGALPEPEAEAAPPAAGPDPAAGPFWSANGVQFPVGLRLRAHYRGQAYHARVTAGGIEFNARLYGSPSAAAIAVKQVAGRSGASAVTNGWYFWQMPCSGSGRWVGITALKRSVWSGPADVRRRREPAAQAGPGRPS